MMAPAPADPWDSFAAALRSLPEVLDALRGLPGAVGLALLAAGVAALGFGARLRRPLAAVGGAAIGLAGGAALAARLGGPPLLVSGVVAAAAAVLAGLVPQLFILGAGALPGALVGLAFPVSGHRWLGMLCGLVLGGGAALLVSRWIAAVAAAALGVALVLAGLFGIAGQSAPLRTLAAHPLVLAAVAGVLTVSGAAFQHARAWQLPERRPEPPPEQATAVAEP